jgi:hypothetical protein
VDLSIKITSLFFFPYNKGVKEFEARWIGWAGVNVPDAVGQKALTKALAEKVLIFTIFHSLLFIENCKH